MSFKKHLSRLFILHFFVVFPLLGVTVDLIPSLPSTMTNAHISQFDIFASGLGPLMFVIQITNPDDSTYTGLRLRYRVYLDSESAGTQGNQRIYEGLSNTFSIKPYESILIKSNDFLTENNLAVRTSIQTTVYELKDPSIKEKISIGQRIPDGAIEFRLDLERSVSGIVIDNDFSQHTITNVTYVIPDYPGREASGGAQTIYEPRPVFSWRSDLLPGVYGTEDIFTIYIYEEVPGGSMADAISRPPFHSASVNALSYVIPLSSPQLEPGTTYYWNVHAKIKGATSSLIKSPVYAFTIYKVANPRVWEIIQQLRLIIDDESVFEKIAGYDNDASIYINGEKKNLAELKQFVAEVLVEETDLEKVDVR
ncbi:MAG: hypothetical protein GF401_15790 [Chitinivibrionales bacterium]|nr:hypothetical protein [Chitinivibrionales bacterium]